MFVLLSQHNRTHGGCPENRDVAETKTSVFSATNYLSTKTASCRKLSVSRHVVVFLPRISWKEESKKGENPVSGVQSHRLTLVGLCNWTYQNPVSCWVVVGSVLWQWFRPAGNRFRDSEARSVDLEAKKASEGCGTVTDDARTAAWQ